MSRYLAIVLFVLPVALSGCASEGTTDDHDNPITEVTSCCECACGSGADLCAVITEIRPGAQSCNNVCADECRARIECDGKADVETANSCDGSDSKTDNPCKETCAILDSCGAGYADEAGCEELCENGEQTAADVTCLEGASCDPTYVQECLAAMPGRLASSVAVW